MNKVCVACDWASDGPTDREVCPECNSQVRYPL
jgi:RNA polymerase subunit RPABC4/transcription elongation factor Spt4